MPDIQRYYSEDLVQLKKRVQECNIDTLDSIEFFLKEANAYTSGIPIDIEKDVRWEINKFKRNCMCIKTEILKKYIKS
jgi:hypothetical protein